MTYASRVLGAEAFQGLYEELLERVRADLSAQPQPRRFLSKIALAEHYGITPRQVKDWRAKGLAGHRVGRQIMFSIEETDRWIEGHDG